MCNIIIQRKIWCFFFSISINLHWRSQTVQSQRSIFLFNLVMSSTTKGRCSQLQNIHFSKIFWKKKKGTLSSCGSFLHIFLKCIDFLLQSSLFLCLNQALDCLIRDINGLWYFFAIILQQCKANVSPGPHRFDNVKLL